MGVFLRAPSIAYCCPHSALICFEKKTCAVQRHQQLNTDRRVHKLSLICPLSSRGISCCGLLAQHRIVFERLTHRFRKERFSSPTLLQVFCLAKCSAGFPGCIQGYHLQCIQFGVLAARISMTLYRLDRYDAVSAILEQFYFWPSGINSIVTAFSSHCFRNMASLRTMLRLGTNAVFGAYT